MLIDGNRQMPDKIWSEKLTWAFIIGEWNIKSVHESNFDLVQVLTLSVKFPRNPKYSLTISIIVNTM